MTGITACPNCGTAIERAVIDALAPVRALIQAAKDQAESGCPPWLTVSALEAALGGPTSLSLIMTERRRQIAEEGYTTEHDFRHPISDLHRAACAYLHGDVALWPWADGFKPKDRKTDLVRAGALFEAVAERYGTGTRAAEMRAKRDKCAALIDSLRNRQ